MTIRAHRLVAAGSLAVAALAAPIAIALTSADAAGTVAGPKCLSHVGNIEDNVCAGYSSGNGINVGTPDIGVYGPNSGVANGRGGGIGVTTGPLLPGQTWNVPIG
jgi:hypothetical protein